MIGLLGKIFVKMIGGSRNDRLVRSRMRFVRERVNPLEPAARALADEQLRAKAQELRGRLAGGESRDTVKAEAFALIREASRRARNHRQFDVQLVAGTVLDEGKIAEEATGEGKTIACYPAIYMAALEGLHVHVVTVNDALVVRDADFARPVFDLLGLSVGYITQGMGNEERQKQYACNVTYGMNSEFGFDYLRDNMKLSPADQVQGPLDFAIVDEVDSILIDEARTPLIISGPAYGQSDRYAKADKVTRELISRNHPWDTANKKVESLKRRMTTLRGEIEKAGGDRKAAKASAEVEETASQLETAEVELAGMTRLFEVELDKKSAHMTHEGTAVAQDVAGVGSFYVGANMEWPHLMEQSLRAHLVYERDKEYVVREGEVVIVDEFTGRLLEGREWSDGLHQAVCAKERVAIKEENQTLATITLQNFFKMYKKLAGMTGTAMTEAAEFLKIYKLDAVTVPTHRPVNRRDFDDRIYADDDAKYAAIVEEINAVSKAGRPVLVGTTSIEKSEYLSELLKRSYGIEHQVLNGRQENASRENEIVSLAGQQRPLKHGSKDMVGTVTIATNMAGRGTDIKLGPGVVWEACRVPAAEELARLGFEPEPLFPAGITKCCLRCPQYDQAGNCSHCFKPKVDETFPLRGRSECPLDVPCGLHIVGTERHEARRIDNQLRGRSGRQGDPGSSRFFLSLRDELIAIFAGPWVLKVLGWLGLQGDVAIEDRRVSKGIERAQKKVEERNFETRKNLLEYDEVMDIQRHAFYGQRQMILEGRDLQGMVKEMCRRATTEAVENYLGGDYRKRCIAEWVRVNLQFSVDPAQVRGDSVDDLDNLEANLRNRAKEEASSVVAMTLGEYMDTDLDQREWDLRGLASWAESRFKVDISQGQLRKMTPPEVETFLRDAAAEQIDRIDLDPLGRFLAADFPARSLAEWARAKFGLEIEAAALPPDRAGVRALLIEKVEQAYARREIESPVEYAIEITIGPASTENVYAVGSLADWANRKYDAGIGREEFLNAKVEDVYARLLGLSRQWLAGGKLEQCVREALGSDPSVERGIALAAERFDTTLTAANFHGDVAARVIEAGREFLRREMTELERYILLQIYDSSWKDHLLAMDHLKSGIGLRGYAEQDPRVAYKREGARQFREMLSGVQEKVTDMIFKVRLTAQTQMSSVYQISNMVHEQLSGYDHLARDMADQQAAAAPQKIETIVREEPRVGRNDPCPCGSGKKYKKCHGKTG